MHILHNFRNWWAEHLLQLWLVLTAVLGFAIIVKRLTVYEGIQVLLTLTLVLVTWRYVAETGKIRESSDKAAKSAEAQARASQTMAEEAKQQRLHSSQPVVWPEIWGWNPNAHCLFLNLINIGNGPALEIDVFVGRGNDPLVADCEHSWRSYLVGGDKAECYLLKQPDSASYRKMVGDYTLLVEWRDLHMSGPFFQARLPFKLEMNPDGNLFPKQGLVNIEPIPAKRIPVP